MVDSEFKIGETYLKNSLNVFISWPMEMIKIHNLNLTWIVFPDHVCNTEVSNIVNQFLQKSPDKTRGPGGNIN